MNVTFRPCETCGTDSGLQVIYLNHYFCSEKCFDEWMKNRDDFKVTEAYNTIHILYQLSKRTIELIEKDWSTGTTLVKEPDTEIMNEFYVDTISLLKKMQEKKDKLKKNDIESKLHSVLKRVREKRIDWF